MSIAAPATNPASDLELKLPATIGSANQFLKNSGTAGTLEFSNNLTFDGTTFQTQHATGAIARVQNSTAATSQSASLELAPANGLLGHAIKSVSEEDFSTGANRTAYLSIEGRKDGTLAERMRIYSSGAVTTPNQPCSFYIGLSNSHTSNATDSTETLVFATVKLNEGSHYNGSNGRFTAPVAGTYFVGLNLLIDDSASVASRSADLQKNGSGYVTMTYDRNGGQYTGMSGTAIIELAVGDYISVRATAGVHIGGETSLLVYLLG